MHLRSPEMKKDRGRAKLLQMNEGNCAKAYQVSPQLIWKTVGLTDILHPVGTEYTILGQRTFKMPFTEPKQCSAVQRDQTDRQNNRHKDISLSACLASSVLRIRVLSITTSSIY